MQKEKKQNRQNIALFSKQIAAFFSTIVWPTITEKISLQRQALRTCGPPKICTTTGQKVPDYFDGQF